MSEPFIYDEVIYPSIVFPHIRPATIGAVAILHNVRPECIENCRVLELGCSDGANLLSIAYSMPESECIGFDLSGPRIDEANSYAAEIGIKNAKFYHLDVMDLDPERFGKFDFIIAQGLYSWVPDVVRERVLWLYSKSLKPTGIGFISYNAYPGWHMRKIVRDAMLFQTEIGGRSIDKTASGVRFIEFLAESARPNTVYKALLENELESLNKAQSEALFHDDLSEFNQPFFFTEFNGQLEKAGLRFLTEAEPVAFFTRIYPEFARAALNKLWNDPIRREQYLDFIRGTRFRSTLVCLPSASPSYRPIPDSVTSLFFGSQSYPLNKDANLRDDSSVAFFATENSEFSTNHPLTKMMIATLRSKWPERLSYEEMIESLRQEFSSLGPAEFEEQCATLRKNIVELVHATMIEPFCFRPKFESVIGPAPKVSDFSRWQAGKGSTYLTNLNGRNITIENDFVRAAAILLDGRRARTELGAAIDEMVTVPEEEKKSLQTSLPDLVDATIEMLRRNALIVR